MLLPVTIFWVSFDLILSPRRPIYLMAESDIQKDEVRHEPPDTLSSNDVSFSGFLPSTTSATTASMPRYGIRFGAWYYDLCTLDTLDFGLCHFELCTLSPCSLE